MLLCLVSISVVEFQKDACAMWIKHAFERDYQEVNFLKTKFRLNITPCTKSQLMGIPSVKCKNILKLADSFPHLKKTWQEIPVNDKNVDLVDHFE